MSNNVNVLSSIQKGDVVQTKNLQIVTRQGTKIDMDNPQISKIKSKEDYPNPGEQKQLYNDASIIFQELAAHEENDDFGQKTTNELIKLINKDESVTKLIDLMYNIKNTSSEDKWDKSICSLNQKINKMTTL